MNTRFILRRKHGTAPVYTKPKDFGTMAITHLVLWSNLFDFHVYRGYFPNCSRTTQVVKAGIKWDLNRQRGRA